MFEILLNSNDDDIVKVMAGVEDIIFYESIFHGLVVYSEYIITDAMFDLSIHKTALLTIETMVTNDENAFVVKMDVLPDGVDLALCILSHIKRLNIVMNKIVM